MTHQVWLVEEPNGRFLQKEVPRPVPKAKQALIRVSASGVNPLDTKIRAGAAEHARQPLPAVLCVDMAGTVEDLGQDVKSFQAGDEVYGLVGGVGGLQGTLAEFIAADVDLLARKPKSLSMREAAALPLSVITAWEGLVDHAKVGHQHKVLIHAGAGGVGYIAIQIAQAYGATVFATVSAEKRGVVEDLGANSINYRSMSVEQYLNAFTDGNGFDIIYDTVGGATLDDSFVSAKRYTGHVLSSLGWGTHSLAPLSFRGASYSGVFTLLPLITGENRAHHGEILARAASFADAGKLKPLLRDEKFTTSDIDSAFARVSARSLGKVVVEING